jgi:hypothetical protein
MSKGVINIEGLLQKTLLLNKTILSDDIRWPDKTGAIQEKFKIQNTKLALAVSEDYEKTLKSSLRTSEESRTAQPKIEYSEEPPSADSVILPPDVATLKRFSFKYDMVEGKGSDVTEKTSEGIAASEKKLADADAKIAKEKEDEAEKQRKIAEEKAAEAERARKEKEAAAAAAAEAEKVRKEKEQREAAIKNEEKEAQRVKDEKINDFIDLLLNDQKDLWEVSDYIYYRPEDVVVTRKKLLNNLDAKKESEVTNEITDITTNITTNIIDDTTQQEIINKKNVTSKQKDTSYLRMYMGGIRVMIDVFNDLKKRYETEKNKRKSNIKNGLKQKPDENTKKIQEIEKKIKEEEDKKKSLLEAVNKKEEAVNKIKPNKELIEKIQKKREEKMNKENEKKEIDKELNESEKIFVDAKSKLEEITNGFDESKDYYNSARENKDYKLYFVYLFICEKLEEQLKVIKKEFKELETKKAEIQKNKDKIDTEIQVIQKELDDLNGQRNNELASELQAQSVTTAQQELKTAQQELKTAQKDIDAAQQQLMAQHGELESSKYLVEFEEKYLENTRKYLKEITNRIKIYKEALGQ